MIIFVLSNFFSILNILYFMKIIKALLLIVIIFWTSNKNVQTCFDTIGENFATLTPMSENNDRGRHRAHSRVYRVKTNHNDSVEKKIDSYDKIVIDYGVVGVKNALAAERSHTGGHRRLLTSSSKHSRRRLESSQFPVTQRQRHASTFTRTRLSGGNGVRKTRAFRRGIRVWLLPAYRPSNKLGTRWASTSFLHRPS